MHNDMTDCPRCNAKETVGEYPSCFGCSDCGYWGPTADKIIYEPEEDFLGDAHDFDGQVARRPAAA